MTDKTSVSTAARAYAAFKDLGRWLMLTDPEVARLVGVRRTTAYSWEREERQPRLATIRRLMQHHAVVAAVVDRLGPDDARTWFASGSPSPVDLLLDGRFDQVDQMVGKLVFAPASDLERVREMLTRAGVAFSERQIKTAELVELWDEDDLEASVTIEVAASPMSATNLGYGGFAANLYFRSDGSLRAMGAWE